jgi:hypothetical membrane protein
MHLMQRIHRFAARHPLVGPIMWLSGIQFFIVQFVAASGWKTPPYSWWLNAISDLGATGCGLFDDDRLVCSPLHGIFPEDSIFWAHIVGQDLAFVFGNIALIIFGFTLRFPRWFRWYSIGSGAVALVALILFLSHHRFFLGLGGMERVVAYPLIIWLIVTGMYVAIKRGRLTAKLVDTQGAPNVS